MVVRNSGVNTVLEHDDVRVIDSSVSWNSRMMEGSDGIWAVVVVRCQEQRGSATAVKEFNFINLLCVTSAR